MLESVLNYLHNWFMVAVYDGTYTIKDGSMDVKKYVETTAKELGGSIEIAEYTHFVKGEGLEKRSEDFAAEVAAAIKG